MLHEGSSQCVLVSGESGAGKTESAKYVLQVLTVAGQQEEMEKAQPLKRRSVAEQIMLGNPVLEAFGNAKTLRNDNSSRFGKWIEIAFEGGKVVGAEVKTYLLEKSRVVAQSAGERNFHVFYDLCTAAVAGEESLEGLGLGAASEYAATKVCFVAGQRVDSFRAIKSALDKMGVPSQTQRSIFSGLAAILHMSSIEIWEDTDDDGNSVAKLDPSSAHFVHASRLLQVSTHALQQGLCTRVIILGKEKLRKPENRANAVLCLHALCKTLYAKIFEGVVELVNSAMSSEWERSELSNTSTANTSVKHVAVLDIFGFESFQVNRFQQLCIKLELVEYQALHQARTC
jgi:myosin-5